MMACRYSNTDSTIETVKLLLNHNDIDVNLFENKYKHNALILLCKNIPDQLEIVKLLKSKTNLNHKYCNNKSIKKICLFEYDELFVRDWDDVLTEYDLTISECIICTKENIKCIVCNYNHTTCLNCLKKMELKCGSCQLEL
jgi:hypothetical protein